MGRSHPASYVVDRTMTTPLLIKKVCVDCGAVIRTLEELDVHDLRCPGPIRLVHLPDGTIIGEVGSD